MTKAERAPYSSALHEERAALLAADDILQSAISRGEPLAAARPAADTLGVRSLDTCSASGQKL